MGVQGHEEVWVSGYQLRGCRAHGVQASPKISSLAPRSFLDGVSSM